MDDDNFSHNVVDAALLLRDCRELAVAVSTAEAGIVQAINNHLEHSLVGSHKTQSLAAILPSQRRCRGPTRL